ncbi:RNA polymerase sigma factor [Conexibacter sp. SYSU D00693]|uniref:RNA polymerase sigma factor n=1 Tax=Conexibacter sp. SYSU D00693 TaxID=2812560 RepID=UPI00196B07E3|nr:sigma-70 family RNA polymerase sigma factor [Conexibacter sp. SYSU D00693]
MALFRAGHDDAFRVMHDRYQARLLAYARQMLGGSRSDAEDALQDVFLRAYHALRADDRPLTLRAWLYRVAHNRCIDQLRRPAPAAEDVFDVNRTRVVDPPDEAERREDLRRLVQDVRRLPDQQRSALLMREMEGLSYVDLSEALGVTVPAVKSLLVRARMGLAEAAEARGAACADIREELAEAVDRGVRTPARARRHMGECAGCRDFATVLRGNDKALAALSPGHGLLGTLAKLIGIGGGASAAGGSAAAGGGATTAVVGGGVAAAGAKVAAVVCCAAVVGGGAVEVRRDREARAGTGSAASAAPARGGDTLVASASAAAAAAVVEPLTTAAGVKDAPAAADAEPAPVGEEGPAEGTHPSGLGDEDSLTVPELAPPPSAVETASGGIAAPPGADEAADGAPLPVLPGDAPAAETETAAAPVGAAGTTTPTAATPPAPPAAEAASAEPAHDVHTAKGPGGFAAP